MNIILHLGGNIERAHTAAQLAQKLPFSTIVVSSETGDFQDIYASYGIDSRRIVVNMEAWDTVTNFTHTYKLLQSLSCERLFVVTDQFHSYRSMLIALAVWGNRVPIYMCPHGHGINAVDEAMGKWNFLRALLWRLTGILIYEKSIKNSRSEYFAPFSRHSRLEIGI